MASVRQVFDDVIRKGQREAFQQLRQAGRACSIAGEVVETYAGAKGSRCVLADLEGGDYRIEVALAPTLTAPVVGHSVVCSGDLECWAEPESAGTKYRLRCSSIVTHGEAPRVAAERAVIERLIAERPRPVAELRAEGEIVVISSAKAHGAQDATERLTAAAVKWRLVPVELTSAGSIAQGLYAVREERPRLVLIVRGGGARVDLAPFDTPQVCAAVGRLAATAIVVVGVGHARDHVRAERFAQHAVATPQAAAELAVNLTRTLSPAVADERALSTDRNQRQSFNRAGWRRRKEREASGAYLYGLVLVFFMGCVFGNCWR